MGKGYPWRLVCVRTFLACCLFPGLLVSHATPADTPDINILYGAYELVGRLPGVSSAPYRGWMRLAVEGEKLSVDRCIDGQHSEGVGTLVIEQSDGDNDSAAIKIHYTQHGQTLEATCEYLNDFQNLPRFSCHTYPTSKLGDNPGKETPGLEAAYPIVWSVPIDYFNCF